MDKLEKFLKDNEHIWPTAGKWWYWFKTRARLGLWKRHPVRYTFVSKRRKKYPIGEGGRMVWGGVCEDCGNTFKEKEMEVDHIIGVGHPSKIEDIQDHIEKLVVITEEDLRWLCKLCHSYHTYAATFKVSLEEAIRRKKEIAAKKKLKPKPKKKVAKKKGRKVWKRK